MTTSKEIHDLISGYLKSKDLDAFAASFAELFYDIESTAADSFALQLAYDVESGLAAITSGVCSEAAFYGSMKTLSPSLSIHVVCTKIESQSVMAYGFITTAGAAAGTEKLAHVGRVPSAGFGSTVVAPGKGQTSTVLPPWQQVILA